MSVKYQHLLSPIKVRNTVFRNRLTAARSGPRFVERSRGYPTEALITHYANKARNGAAMVTCRGVGMPHFILEGTLNAFSPDRIMKRIPGSFDIDDANCQRSISDLAEAIHFYGGKAAMQIGGYVPVKYDVSAGIMMLDYLIPGMTPRTGEEIPASLLDDIVDDFVRQAAVMKKLGFDVVVLHMAYRLTILGRFLSPLTNKRTDQYGGSLVNRARFPLMVAEAIKRECGKDFLIEAPISGEEPPGGLTIEDTIALAKMFEGHLDMLQVRTGSLDPAHPTGFRPERNPFLSMAEAVKKSGTGIRIVTVGGFLDPALSEEIIASGKADFIAMGRGWICNPEYGRIVYEGRGEDVVPCLRCNTCLSGSMADPLVSVCAVNPTWGLEHEIHRMIQQAPAAKKRVAVVGGGPAGMKAALVASDRGHEVILYEASENLGGLLKTIEQVSFKWPVREFRDYLIRQVMKARIDVQVNTKATPDMLREEGYDVVLAAIGADPLIPPIPGLVGKNVVWAGDIYGKEHTLEKEVVIIGGGEVGIETGIHLARKGHEVTVLEMGSMLAPKAPPVHFYNMFREAWEKESNLTCIVNARCTGIGTDNVTYTDAEGAEHVIAAGSVILAAGMKPRDEQALAFYGAAEKFFMIGDCAAAGNIQKAIRGAFAAASTL